MIDKVNPDFELLKTLLWVSGSIITILLTTVGYFVKEKISSQKKEIEDKENLQRHKFDKLELAQKEQLEEIKKVVSTLEKTVVNVEKVVEVIRRQQEERDPRTEKRLNAHSERLDSFDKRITVIETKMEIRV